MPIGHSGPIAGPGGPIAGPGIIAAALAALDHKYDLHADGRIADEFEHYERVVSKYWKGRELVEHPLEQVSKQTFPSTIKTWEASRILTPISHVQVHGEQAKRRSEPITHVVVEDDMAIVLMMMMEMSK